MFVDKWQQLCAYTQSFLFSELNERNMEKKGGSMETRFHEFRLRKYCVASLQS